MNNNHHPKRVCMIAMSSYPIDPRIRRQAEALDEAGYEVDILCRNSGDQPSKEKFGNVTAYRIMNAPRQDSKIKYFMVSIIFLFVAFFRLVFLSIKRKYLVIQVHNLPDYLIFAGLLHKIFGAKLILDIHDPSVDLFDEKWPGKKNKILKYFVKKLEQYSCKVADHLITVTKTCKERLIERGTQPDKITVIFNSANESVFKYNHTRNFQKIERGIKLCYHGSMAERFGLDIAIKAMQLILEEIPDSRFDVYGKIPNSYGTHLKELIVKCNLENNVYLNGLIKRELIPEVLRNSDIGIVPHLNSEYANLALPTKAFEYIASGLPLISTYLSDLAQTFGDKSITFCQGNSAQDLAEKVIFLAKDPDTRKLKVKNAYKELRKISGTVMAEKYVKLINLFRIRNNKTS
ncbi:MAG: glycosyltransferase family 4 protein [Bacteroidetes bacterium]|nr:glycosyltransferase family 4 protein [Bacteroidota bacterium]